VRKSKKILIEEADRKKEISWKTMVQKKDILKWILKKRGGRL
jgi:hypothetical protein